MTGDLFLQTLLPTTHDLGGFKVHRTLPHRQRTTIGPFIFFDQMGPARLEPGRGPRAPVPGVLVGADFPRAGRRGAGACGLQPS